MSLPIAIAINIALCVLLLAALAWTMTRPRKLKPHVSSTGRRLSLVEQEIYLDDGEQEEDRRAA
jgi:hypothetical protein